MISFLGPKVPDTYSGQPIHSVLQGIHLELLLGRAGYRYPVFYRKPVIDVRSIYRTERLRIEQNIDPQSEKS